jgi:5-formyltetrahydrofolate cyclo-ligase
MLNKNELRALMRERKQQFTQQQLGELSAIVVSHMREYLMLMDNIVAYYSLPDEVCTHQLLDELVTAGKTVYLPKVVSDTEMVLCQYTGRDSLQKGAFDIMEPTGPVLPEDKYEDIRVVLVPGMAFDKENHRLGRGKGYYDRFLNSFPKPRHAVFYGVCFDFQCVDAIPVDEHDECMDGLIS